MNELFLPLLLMGILSSGETLASKPVAALSSQQPLTTVQSETIRPASAKAWGLTQQEWSRFEQIKTGPRGYWSPHLDPLTTLGVEATTDAERQRYAELQVRLEAQRAERELAYQNAYTAAWAELYPQLLPVNTLTTPVPPQSPRTTRVALFVEDDCDPCIAAVSHFQQRGTPFDLFLVGSENDDDHLRRWAQQAKIATALVQRRQITLNHDRGRWFSLGAPGPLPVSFEQVNGRWLRVE
jgi:integrating conjugative element protein (TIGR03759 family)